MKEQLISFDTAKLAKEKGFGRTLDTIYPCSYKLTSLTEYALVLNSQNNTKDAYISAPRQSELQKWLREEHDIHIHVNWVYRKTYDTNVDWHYDVKGIGLIQNNLIPLDETKFDSYEKALEKGLYEALKLTT